VALVYVADTSVLTRLSSGSVRAVIEPLVQAGEVARAAISDLEIGYSARDANEWDRLTGSLDVFVLIEASRWQHRRAGQVQRRLADRRQRGRKIPDLLVAAAAEEHGLTVLHYDRDFALIAGVTGQDCRWVVPAGSID